MGPFYEQNMGTRAGNAKGLLDFARLVFRPPWKREYPGQAAVKAAVRPRLALGSPAFNVPPQVGRGAMTKVRGILPAGSYPVSAYSPVFPPTLRVSLTRPEVSFRPFPGPHGQRCNVAHVSPNMGMRPHTYTGKAPKRWRKNTAWHLQAFPTPRPWPGDMTGARMEATEYYPEETRYYIQRLQALGLPQLLLFNLLKDVGKPDHALGAF